MSERDSAGHSLYGATLGHRQVEDGLIVPFFRNVEDTVAGSALGHVGLSIVARTDDVPVGMLFTLSATPQSAEDGRYHNFMGEVSSYVPGRWNQDELGGRDPLRRLTSLVDKVEVIQAEGKASSLGQRIFVSDLEPAWEKPRCGAAAWSRRGGALLRVLRGGRPR